jgi:hypothetical protein
MHQEDRELTIETVIDDHPLPPARYAGTESELRRVAEQAHGGPLDWYKAYRGNLYAEDHDRAYAIRRLPPADVA